MFSEDSDKKSGINKLLEIHKYHYFELSKSKSIRIKMADLFKDILPHIGPDTDACMNQLIVVLMPQLGNDDIAHRKTTVHILQIYLKFTADIQSVLRLELKQANKT